MTGPITLGGLGSGLDTKTLIRQIMQIEQKPLLALQHSRDAQAANNAAFQGLKAQLSLLLGAASDLTLDLNLKAKLATASDPTTLTAQAGSGAAVGTYQVRVDQLATAGSVTAGNAIGAPITSTTTSLRALNFSSPIQAGNFTLQYTSGGVVKNASVTVNATDTLGTVFANISAATGGAVTAGLGAGATANKIVLTAAAGTTNVVAGATGDTSNFLAIANLKGASYSTPGTAGGTLTSTYGIGVTQINNVINTGTGLSTPITATTTGAFTINGTTINYDTSKDSIGSIMTKINASNAGVTASYNPVNDKLVLTARTTGSGAITLSDVSGNFLAATSLTGASASVTSGQNALIGIVGVNGFTASTVGTANDVTSTTNSFSNVISGVTFNAQKVNGSLVTVTVAPDRAALTGKVQAFIDQYNKTIDALDAARAKGQPNAFDPDLARIEKQLQTFVSGTVSGLSAPFNNLMDIGIATSRNDTHHLSLNAAKFNNALNTNPDAVALVFNKANTGVAVQFRNYLTGVESVGGLFSTRDRAAQANLRRMDAQITTLNARLDQQSQLLNRQFSAMDSITAKLHSQQNALLSQLMSLK